MTTQSVFCTAAPIEQTESIINELKVGGTPQEEISVIFPDHFAVISWVKNIERIEQELATSNT